MTSNQMHREAMYGASRSVGGELLANGFISQKELSQLDALMRKKYRPVIGGGLSDATLGRNR